jgi:POT family proton-dependent oligopeptide transporter
VTVQNACEAHTDFVSSPSQFKTIYFAIGVATLGHILIIIAAIPQVMGPNPEGALASFILGLILFGTGV